MSEASVNDDPVVQYLAAIEARRAAPSHFPQPDRASDDLASGAMMQMEPTDDNPEGLRRDLAAHTPGSDANIERLEEGFVAHADGYARRHGTTYEAWIQAGVDREVLDRAGIRRED